MQKYNYMVIGVTHIFSNAEQVLQLEMAHVNKFFILAVIKNTTTIKEMILSDSDVIMLDSNIPYNHTCLDSCYAKKLYEKVLNKLLEVFEIKDENKMGI